MGLYIECLSWCFIVYVYGNNHLNKTWCKARETNFYCDTSPNFLLFRTTLFDGCFHLVRFKKNKIFFEEVLVYICEAKVQVSLNECMRQLLISNKYS